MLLASARRLHSDPSIPHSLEPLGISERDFGDFVFDYLTGVDRSLQASFGSKLSQLKQAMAGFLTQHFCKIVKKELPEMTGLLCYGMQTQSQITVFHFTVRDRPRFADILKDVIALLFQRHCTVNKISLALRYIAPATPGLRPADRALDPQLKSDLKSFGFKTKSVHVDLAERKTAFLTYQLDAPVPRKDPLAENLRFNLRIFLSRLPLDRPPKKASEAGDEASPFLSIDVRSALLWALSSYTGLFENWRESKDFSKPLYSIALQDLVAVTEALAKRDTPPEHISCVASRSLEKKSQLSESELARLSGPGSKPVRGSGQGRSEVLDAARSDQRHALLRSQLAVGVRYCEHSSIRVKFNSDRQAAVRSYLHVRKVSVCFQNAEMYSLTVKKHSSELFVLHTDDPQVSLFVVNDFKIFKEANKLKHKKLLSQLILELFDVRSAHQDVEASLRPLEKNLWLPCFRAAAADLELSQITAACSLSFVIPINSAVVSFAVQLAPNAYDRGLKIEPEPEDLVVRPPFIMGLLMQTVDEVVGKPWFSCLVSDNDVPVVSHEAPSDS